MITVAALVRLALAASVPLVPDETYYWEWSRRLASGYFDHPGAIADLVRAGTALAGVTPLGVRLGAVVAGWGASLCLTLLARRLAGDDAALRAAVIITCMPLAAAGLVLATPDAPLLLATSAALLLLDHAVTAQPGSRSALGWWLAAGVALGAAFFSKYNAVLLPLAVLIALLAYAPLRRQLATPAPYLAALAALLVFTPVIVWNASHDWVSFRFQLAHGVGSGGGSPLAREAALIGGQLGLVSPLLFVLLAIVVSRSLARGGPRRALLAVSAATVFIFFCLTALSRPAEANWQAIAYIPAVALLAAHRGGRVWRNWLGAACALGAVVVSVTYLQALSPFLPISANSDPTARGAGWDALAEQVERAAGESFPSSRLAGMERAGEAGGEARAYASTASLAASRSVALAPSTWIAANRYQEASALAFHLPGHPITFSLNIDSRPNQYDLWPSFPSVARAGDNLVAVLDVPPDGESAPVIEALRPHFRRSWLWGTVSIARRPGAHLVRRIWLLEEWDGKAGNGKQEAGGRRQEAGNGTPFPRHPRKSGDPGNGNMGPRLRGDDKGKAGMTGKGWDDDLGVTALYPEAVPASCLLPPASCLLNPEVFPCFLLPVPCRPLLSLAIPPSLQDLPSMGDSPCWLHLFNDLDMTDTLSSDVAGFLATHQERIHEELFEFLRIPSVSARSEHRGDIKRAAEWVAASMREAGLAAEIMDTGGHPVVLGEWRGAGENAKTVLVYGHYDVQPAEPLELWESPPFEPELRDGKIFARGSVDDKGQLFLHIKAIQAHLATRGKLPVNVIVLAEGEEEVGSDNLAPFIERHRSRLACDYVVISDSSMFAPGQPSILSSLRGLAYLELTVQGPSSDLHSGSYGGAVVNPAMALCRILATFHDAQWRVAIPGFYDSVRDWSTEAREQIRSLPFDEEQFRAEVGAGALDGEREYSTLERLWTRPTCEVNGLLSGYTGEGAKTVLPAKAMAKVSCRLVPDQKPEEIERLVRAHVERVAPAGVTVTVTPLHGGYPWRAELDGPLFDAARRALASAFGREPVITGEGGSIPVVGDFERLLKAPVLLMGFGLPGENAHAPNEWLSDENFVRGMQAVAVFWDEL